MNTDFDFIQKILLHIRMLTNVYKSYHIQILLCKYKLLDLFLVNFIGSSLCLLFHFIIIIIIIF